MYAVNFHNTTLQKFLEIFRMRVCIHIKAGPTRDFNSLELFVGFSYVLKMGGKIWDAPQKMRAPLYRSTQTVIALTAIRWSAW
jgi:hypothetical protein